MEKNYYETLKLSPDATKKTIREAFSSLQKVYGEGSSAVYSIYSPEQRKEIMDRIEGAYKILIDPVKRKVYDSALRTGSETFSDISHGTLDTSFDEAPEISELRNEVRYDIKLKEPLAVMDGSRQFICEQYRILYTKLETLNKNQDKGALLAITSATKGDGKTATSMNLAYVISTVFRKKVLLIEADLKNPTMADFFQKGKERGGLVDVLKGEKEFNSSICRIEQTSFYVVMAGQTVANSSEILYSPVFNKLLTDLRKRFDYILIDSPSILPHADMAILSKLVDGLLIVVRAGKTSRNLVSAAVKHMSNANIIGMILNDSDNVPNISSY